MLFNFATANRAIDFVPQLKAIGNLPWMFSTLCSMHNLYVPEARTKLCTQMALIYSVSLRASRSTARHKNKYIYPGCFHRIPICCRSIFINAAIFRFYASNQWHFMHIIPCQLRLVRAHTVLSECWLKCCVSTHSKTSAQRLIENIRGIRHNGTPNSN